MSTTFFNALGCLLLASLFTGGCASTNSNGRRYKDTTSIHVVPVEPTTKVAGVVDIAVEAAVALAKFGIKSEAKHYEAASEASLLWTAGITPTNPVMLAVVRTFEKKAEFQTPCLDHFTNEIVEASKNRLANMGFVLPEKHQVKFLSDLTNSHKAESKVSLVVLFLVHPGESKTMNCTLLGYSYPVLKAKNASFKVPFTKWHTTKSALTVSFEGAQGFSAAAYKAQRVIGPKVLVWPRGKCDMQQWKPKELPDWSNLVHQAPGIRSVPFQYPGGPLEITATLVESSDMKKTLESLGDRVGKLKLGDIKD